MKSAQEVINWFKEDGWCLNQSKMELIVCAYNLGVKDIEADKCEGGKNE